jgi:hypothetical protein
MLPAAVIGAGAAGTVLALAARTIHYSGLSLPGPLEETIGRFLEISVSLIFVQLTAFLPLSGAGAAVVGVLWLWRRSALLQFTENGWRTRLYLNGFLWLQIFSTNFLLDLDPRLALSFGAGVVLHLALASSAGKRWLDGRRMALWLTWLGLFLLLAPFQRAWVDQLAIALWCAAQPWLTGMLSRAESWSDRLWPGAISMMAGQLVSAWTPYFVSDPALPFLVAIFAGLRYVVYRLVGRPRRWLARAPLGVVGLAVALASGWALSESLRAESRGAGGTRLGTDLVYNFCESPARGRLAATVPFCSGPGGPQCIRGRIDLFDLDTLERMGSLHPFDQTFSGRMEQIVCQDDRLLVGMCCAWLDSRRERLTVMSLDWNGEVTQKSLTPDHDTNRVVLESSGESLWLVGRDVVHLEAGTGARELIAARKPPGIFVVERASKSDRRGSVFLGEFMDASSVLELDRRSLAPKREIDTNNGSVVAVTVDDPMGRAWVTGLWGVEVYDLESGERVAAKRLGFAVRTPLVDERNGVVYVPSTASGKIYVLDREEVRVLGAIAIGFGPRNVFLANRGRWFLASSEHGLWYWDAAELAARFKRLGSASARP